MSSAVEQQQEEGASGLLAADTERAAVEASGAPFMRSVWFNRAAAAAAVVAALGLATAVVVSATGTTSVNEDAPSHEMSPVHADTSSALTFYLNPQGKNVCQTGDYGQCACDCAWAQSANACSDAKVTHDGTCCFACCCPNRPVSGGLEGAYQGDNYDPIPVPGHGDAFHGQRPVQTECPRTYSVGQVVQVRAKTGNGWCNAQITGLAPDCHYQVEYINAEAGCGDSEVVLSHSLVYSSQKNLMLSAGQWWWVLFFVLLGLVLWACYLARRK